MALVAEREAVAACVMYAKKILTSGRMPKICSREKTQWIVRPA
jgi:hypothetical protein